MIDFSDRQLMDKKVLDIYERSLINLGKDETEQSVGELSVHEVMRAHFLIADYFIREGDDDGQGLGGIGPKSIDLLVSAVSRQSVSFCGIEKWNTIHEKAATLLFGLVMNHPFHDANKRTGYLSVIHFYYKNGYIMEATEKELEDLTVKIADRGLSKYPRFRDLTKYSDDPEVEYIAHWLKTKTRRSDTKQYLITYRELNKIIGRYGAWMDNPRGNHIDVMRKVRIKYKSRYFWKPAVEKEEVRRVCSFGFPGWSRQVGKGRLSYIRKELGLTVDNGIDSNAFFNGVDDMQVLIQIYEGALRRLAYR